MYYFFCIVVDSFNASITWEAAKEHMTLMSFAFDMQKLHVYIKLSMLFLPLPVAYLLQEF